jgi:hypothetical protein
MAASSRKRRKRAESIVSARFFRARRSRSFENHKRDTISLLQPISSLLMLFVIKVEANPGSKKRMVFLADALGC